MIKLIWWMIKNLIWGEDFNADFNFPLTFEEALNYIRKGYFIYDDINPNELFFLIENTVYCVDTKKKIVKTIPGFSFSGSLTTIWKAIPMGEHVKGIKCGK